MSQIADEQSQWKSVYKLGGWISLVLILYSLVTMVLLVGLGTPPVSASETFEMFQKNRFVALLRLDLLTVLVYMPSFFLLFLGLYAALRKTHPVSSTITLLLGCAGVTLFLATPSVFSWLALYDRFATASSDAQLNLLLSAGEALLVSDMWHGTGAVIGSILIQSAATLVSISMLTSDAFGKATAYVGVVTHGSDLVRILISFFFPPLSFILMAIAGPLYLIWFPLLARDFFKLSRRDTNQA